MKIFLIGFMGCGKTTLSKKLAAKLGYGLVDLDHVIEETTDSTIGNYFSAHGEDAFRKLESETLKQYAYPENCVVATGGGTPCYFDNMQWMKTNGTTIYIQLSATALARRLEKGKAKRPLLRNLDEEGLIQFIEERLRDRNPFYQQAEFILSGHDLTPERVRLAIADKFQ